MTLNEIRQKYPDYDDLSDQELADAMYAKFYSDMDRMEFDSKIGLKLASPEPVDITKFQMEPKEPRSPGQFVMEEGASAIDALREWSAKNQETVGGATGALIGTAIGAKAGPPGMAAGNIIGGAIGSAIGDARQQQQETGEVDEWQSILAAGQSLGIDLATLGMGKYIVKPGWVAMKKKLGWSSEELATAIQKEVAEKAGSPQSLLQTQQFLADRGATLTPFQAGDATSWTMFKQRLAETGMLSRGIMKGNVDRINTAVKKTMQDLINTEAAVDKAELGQNMFGVLRHAREALSEEYGRGLKIVEDKLKAKFVRVDPILNQLEAMKRKAAILGKGADGKFTVVDYNLKKETVNTIDSWLQTYANIKQMDGQGLISLEKKLRKDISDFGVGTGKPDAAVEKELMDVLSGVQDAIGRQMDTVDSTASAAYRKLQKDYAVRTQQILPEITDAALKSANVAQNFDQLGRLTHYTSNISEVKGFMKSIESAYENMARLGVDTSNLAYKNVADAKRAVRSGYVANLLPTLSDTAFDFQDYANLALKKQDVDEIRKMKIVMGEDYSSFKRILNVIADASKKPEGNLGELIIRGREMTAASGVAAGAFLSQPTLIPPAALIFLTPAAMAKAATNPKNVAKLNMIVKDKTKTFDQFVKQMALLGNDLIKQMDDASLTEAYKQIGQSEEEATE